jgi:phospholipid/cholesterol/gamma-HCH transport system substrate-binding protein
VKTQNDHVVITLRIDNDETIFENEIASIGADSFFGDAVIEILPLPVDQRGNPIADGKFISHVSVKRNPLEIVDVALDLESEISETLSAVKKAGSTIDQAGQGVNKLATTVQEALDSDDSNIKQLIVEFKTMSQKAQTAIDNFNRVFENVNDVIGDPDTKNRFAETISSLPKIFEELRAAISDTRETITSFQKISSSADTNLKNLQEFTDSLKTEGPDILQKINDRIDNVDSLFAEMQKAAEAIGKLRSSEGTVGKLLNDSELYDSALESVNNIRDLTCRLAPLLNDLRVFGDSIARDPGQLGLRGAIRNRSAEGTGYKGTAARRGFPIGRPVGGKPTGQQEPDRIQR